MAAFSLRFIRESQESNTEFELKGLDEQSTVSALKAALADAAPLAGPFVISYGCNLTKLAARDAQSLKSLGISAGDHLVFEPVDADAAKPKAAEKKEEEPPAAPPSFFRQLSEPFAYDLDGASAPQGEGELSLEGWDDDAKELGEERLEEEEAPMAPPPVFRRQQSWSVIGNVEINEMQKSMIEHITELMSVTSEEAAIMLRSYDWKEDDLLMAFTTNPEQVREKAGLKATKKEKDEVTVADEEEVDCPLCYTSSPFKDTTALDCGDRFCNDCWRSWLEAAFDKGAECIFTACPKFKCGQVVPVTMFMTFLDKEKALKVEQYLTTAFVKSNSHIKWCPKAGCDRAVEYRGKGMKSVVCQCGHRFCFGCAQECHEPAPCEAVAQWNAKNSSESSIFAWIEKSKNDQDVKNCTKCKVVIEKNQGCKHMTCKNCKHEFCWLCYQNWNGHNENICTEYQKSNSAKEREKRENEGDEGGDEFRRYQFYFVRFDNHEKSIVFAERIRSEALDRMDKLQDLGGEGKQRVQFLLDAVTEVIECRRLLQWSYPWCYYLTEDSNLYRLFKGHQESLEKFTEELHEQTERPINSLFEGDSRIDIINKTRVLRNYRRNIVDFAKSNH